MFDSSALPREGRPRVLWQGLAGAATARYLDEAAHATDRPLLVLARDAAAVARLEDELKFFGVIGGWLGRALFRHKTLHRSFLAVLVGASAVWAMIVASQILG